MAKGTVVYDLADGDTRLILDDLGTGAENILWQVNGVGLDAADLTIELQDSNDKVKWNEIKNNAGTILKITQPTGTGTGSLRSDLFYGKFMSAVITRNAVTQGVLTFIRNYKE